MRRRTVLWAVGAAAASLGGCLQDPPTGTPSTRSSTTSPPTSDPPDVTSYDSLSPEGKRLFERLLDGDVTVARTEIPPGLWEADAVDYRGTVYAVTRTQTHEYESQYSLSSSYVDADTVDDEEAVVAFEDLPPAAQRAFEASREGASGSQFSSGDRPPEVLFEHDFVRYRGDYYRIAVAVGDVPTFILSASRAR